MHWCAAAVIRTSGVREGMAETNSEVSRLNGPGATLRDVHPECHVLFAMGSVSSKPAVDHDQHDVIQLDGEAESLQPIDRAVAALVRNQPRMMNHSQL